MTRNYFWYNLIVSSRNNNIIIDGLTIPFILGAKKMIVPAFKIHDDSVFELLSEIAGAETDEKAVLKYTSTKQYILTLRDSLFCKENLSGALIFKNEMGQNSLHVSKEVAVLGNTIEEISKALNEIYKNRLEKQTFSYDDSLRRWQAFSTEEKNIIMEASR